MAYVNMASGELWLNKTITPDCKKIVEDILTGNEGKVSGSIVEFSEYYDDDIESTVKTLVDKLSASGYLVNGSISVYNYVDFVGRVEVNENKVRFLDDQDCLIADSPDKALIEELESRGYRIEKVNH